jgi:hypothetical protein
MEWVIAIGLFAAGLIGGILVFAGKRDPLTRPYTPSFFRHPGSFFESNPRHKEKDLKKPPVSGTDNPSER